MADSMFQAGISKWDTISKTGGNNIFNNLLDSLNNAWKTALFMEALRNLNWSRGYCWYVELDGVPNPFQRGGVLGLPAKSVTFTLADGGEFSFNASTIEGLTVPKMARMLSTIQLNVMDDEQGTLRQFFERWYNQIYNPYLGVLPVTEACKQITIYYQKSTRRNVKRIYYNIDESVNNIVKRVADYIKPGWHRISKTTEGMDFLVYPTNPLQMSLDANQNDLISFNVTLQVAAFLNQDFGDPNTHNGVNTIFDMTSGAISQGKGWLDKIADYI